MKAELEFLPLHVLCKDTAVEDMHRVSGGRHQ